MFAQANSEHCRHKIFNASWIIDGAPQEHSLFGMIRETEKANPQGTILAYSDNSAVMEGGDHAALLRAGRPLRLRRGADPHAHEGGDAQPPDGDLAVPGRGDRLRRRDPRRGRHRPRRQAQGGPVRLLGVEPAHPRRDAAVGDATSASPDRIASALDIMLEGPIGAAAFNNEFGRPNLAGYFRTFELEAGGLPRGYHKPIMIAGGLGNIRGQHTVQGAAAGRARC